jgi:hypothetical protein
MEANFMRFHLIFILWGERFAQYLCEDALPALLGTGNLPDWPWQNETSLEIYCPPTDWAQIADSEIFQDCQKWVNLRWHAIEIPQSKGKYHSMGQIHAQAIEIARAEKAGVILLGPDIIVCENTFLILAKYLNQGTEMVLIAGPIVISEAYRSYNQAKRWSKTWAKALISEAAHPGFRAAHIGQTQFPALPSCLLYTQAGQLKGRFFHLHPLLILHPQAMPIENYAFSPTIDGEYMQEFWPIQSQIQIDQNQEIIAFSFHSEQEPRDELLSLDFPNRLARALQIARGTYRDFHYWLAQHEILLGEAHASWPSIENSEPEVAACVAQIPLTLAIHQAYLKQDWHNLALFLETLSKQATLLLSCLDLLDLELLLPFYQVLLALFCLRQKAEFETHLETFKPFITKLANQIPTNQQPGLQDLKAYLSESAQTQILSQAENQEISELADQPYFLVLLQTENTNHWLPLIQTQPATAETLVLIGPHHLLEETAKQEEELSKNFVDLLFWEQEALSEAQKTWLMQHASGLLIESHLLNFNLALWASWHRKTNAIL